MTAINRQIHELAPVLNSPAILNGVTVKSSSQEAPVAAMARRHGGALYLFAVGMRKGKATATFTLPGLKGQAKAEVLHEKRALKVLDGVFRDTFEPWDVHFYKITAE